MSHCGMTPKGIGRTKLFLSLSSIMHEVCGCFSAICFLSRCTALPNRPKAMEPNVMDSISNTVIQKNHVVLISSLPPCDCYHLKIFYVHECLTCLHACTSLACLVPVEAKNRVLSPLEVKLQLVEQPCELEIEFPLKQQQEVLTVEHISRPKS